MRRGVERLCLESSSSLQGPFRVAVGAGPVVDLHLELRRLRRLQKGSKLQREKHRRSTSEAPPLKHELKM